MIVAFSFGVAITDGVKVTITVNQKCENYGSQAVQKMQFAVSIGNQT
jgi:hypothetical protein